MADFVAGIVSAAKSITQNTEIRQWTDRLSATLANLQPCQQIVWEATTEEPWGPTGPQMKEISNLTYQYDQFYGVMNMLYKRMFEDNKQAWRRVYKSLVLINYLLQHGSERVVSSAKDNLFHIRALESYKFTDAKGKDEGINVRHRAKIIIDLLQDDDKLRAERKKAKGDSKEKYQGYTSDDIKMGRGGTFDKNSSDRMSYNDDHRSYNSRKFSWEDDNKKETVSHREVNAFQFPDERRDSGSPELGFRDDSASAAVGDDDDFGDFASARSSTNKHSAAQRTSVPAIPPPKINAVAFGAPAKVSPAPAGGSFDLLGLDTPASQTAQPSQTAAHDFFASPPVVNNAVARPPRPPSGGGINSPVSSSQPALIDDLFGASPVTQNVTPSANAFGAGFDTTANLTSEFSDFSPFAGAAPQVNHTQTAPNSLSGFDFFSNGNSGAASTMPHSVSYGGMTATTPTSSAPKPMSTPSKVGSTWAGASGLIDLDNLGGKKTVKAAVPMNQMAQKNTQPQTSPNSGFPW